MIFIITCKEDVHPNTVINLLNEKNISFFRLNTDALLTDYRFSWKYSKGRLQGLYIEDLLSGKKIQESQISAVWIRRPQTPQKTRYSYDEAIDKHNVEEAKEFIRYLLYYLHNIYSIGNQFYESLAESKFEQYRLALQLGMDVPDTCFSNTKKDIISFAKLHSDVVLKPLHSYSIRKEDLFFPLLTTKVTAKELCNISSPSFTQTVNFCQNYVEKKYELRVTVMGCHIFACMLDSQSQKDDEGKIDWRQGYDHGLKHKIVTLPNNVEEFCRNYLRELHLRFGCFDFIVTPEDQYVFLECNPNGQWRWIEDETGAPMSEAMVDCLVNKREV